MAAGTIRIGIGGWTFPPWRGVFYPPKLPQSKELEFAARAVTAIEINATFYGRQKPKSWENWESIAPGRLPVRGEGIALLRDAGAARRGPGGHRAISSPKG